MRASYVLEEGCVVERHSSDAERKRFAPGDTTSALGGLGGHPKRSCARQFDLCVVQGMGAHMGACFHVSDDGMQPPNAFPSQHGPPGTGMARPTGAIVGMRMNSQSHVKGSAASCSASKIKKQTGSMYASFALEAVGAAQTMGEMFEGKTMPH